MSSVDMKYYFNVACYVNDRVRKLPKNCIVNHDEILPIVKVSTGEC